MFKYIATRIAAFIPTLVLISLGAFIVSISAPGDPVERLLRAADSEGGTSEQSSSVADQRQELRRELGLDRPVFYFTIGNLALPDTMYRIPDKTERKAMAKIVNRNGNWSAVSDYYRSLQAAVAAHSQVDVDAIIEGTRETAVVEKTDSLGVTYMDTVDRATLQKNDVQNVKNRSNIAYVTLMRTHEPEVIQARFDSLEAVYARSAYMAPVAEAFARTREAYETMRANPQKWKPFIPTLQWHGFFNQYHLWLFGDVPYVRKNPGNRERLGMVRGDFGISFHDGQPIAQKIRDRVKWSLVLAALGIGFAYLISVPIGIYSAYKRNGWFDRLSSVFLFVLYSLPVFFVGTWLLYQFANPDNMVLFPESGIMDPSRFSEDMSFWEKFKHRLPFFVLPTITYTYGSLAFLSRIMRVGMIEVFGQDYIRTARAKGLAEKSVVLKHALRNSLIPIITVFANIFPVAIGGSIIIEMIFSYPGMGVMIFEAVINQDYPVIVTVFTILGFFTMMGYLVSDVLYGIVDPRISYK